MKGLLYKHFMINRVGTLGTGLLLIPFWFFSIRGAYEVALHPTDPESTMVYMLVSTMTYFMSSFLILAFSHEFFIADEKPVCFSFLFSTPQAAKGLIQSKYYFLLLVSLVILFVFYLLDTVCILIMGEYAISCMAAYVVLFSGSLILTAFNIPFLIRFGSKSGKQTQLLYFALFSSIISIYALFGDISFLFIDDIFVAWDNLLAYLRSEKVIFVLSLIPYIAVMMYYLSYRISLLLYRKGVENYEQ